MHIWLPKPDYGLEAGVHSYPIPAELNGARFSTFGTQVIDFADNGTTLIQDSRSGSAYFYQGEFVALYGWSTDRPDLWSPLNMSNSGIIYENRAQYPNSEGLVVNGIRTIGPGISPQEYVGEVNRDNLSIVGIKIGNSNGIHSADWSFQEVIEGVLINRRVSGIWKNGFIPLEMPGDHPFAGFGDINDKDQMIGSRGSNRYYYLPSGDYGKNSGFNVLPSAGENEGTFSMLTTHGELYRPSGRSFFSIPENQLYSLNTILGQTDFALDSIRKINGAGQVLVNGTDSDGSPRNFILAKGVSAIVKVVPKRVKTGETFNLDVTIKNNSEESFILAGVFGESFKVFGSALAGLEQLENPPATNSLASGATFLQRFPWKSNTAGKLQFGLKVLAVSPDGTENFTQELFSNEVVIGSLGDLLIKSKDQPESSFSSNDIYQQVPSQAQAQSALFQPGETYRYDVKIENDGEDTVSYVLRANAINTADWTIKYTHSGSDLTELLGSSGFWEVPDLESKTSTMVEVEMTSPSEPGERDPVVFLTLQEELTDTDSLDSVSITIKSINAIVVNDPGDEPDADLNDGVPDVNLDKEGLQTTLRAAIQFANQNPGADTIEFDLDTGAVAAKGGFVPREGSAPSISPVSALPDITDTLIIDGTTQPGSGMVNISGLLAGLVDALKIKASDSKIKGLAITQFGGAGISVDNANNVEISGNVLGTDMSGSSNLGNGIGIRVSNANNPTIGGTTAASRNVVSSNGSGIQVFDSDTVKILSNIVGTDASGSMNLPNTEVGLLVERTNELLVGITEMVSVFNSATAAVIKNVSSSNCSQMINCHIGLNAEGNAALGGTSMGVCVEDTDTFHIGGDTPDKGNVFAGIEEKAIELLNSENLFIQNTKIGMNKAGTEEIPVKQAIVANEITELNVIMSNIMATQQAAYLNVIKNIQCSSIRGCTIGLNAEGTAALGEMANGVCIENSESFEVGGPKEADQNTFGGISGTPLELLKSINILVENNHIGMNKAGTEPLPGEFGIVADEITEINIRSSRLLATKQAAQMKAIRNIQCSSIRGTTFGLKSNGEEAFGGMETGICLIDCVDFEVGGPDEEHRNWFGGISGNAVEVFDSEEVLVQNNRFGTNESGTSELEVLQALVAEGVKEMNALDNLLVTRHGIIMKAVSSIRCSSVRGNSFGTNSGGDALLGSMELALCIEDSDVVEVGGQEAGQGNVFAGIAGRPLEILNSKNIAVMKNMFGTDKTGTMDFGNTDDNIYISNGSDEISITLNTIANGSKSAVNVDGELQKAIIRQNEMFNQTSGILRIRHDASMQIVSALKGSTQVTGTATGLPESAAILDFYAHDPNSPVPVSQTYIGTLEVQLDGNGSYQYDHTFPRTSPQNWLITSTVTDDINGTTEFSPSIEVDPYPDNDMDGLPDYWEAMYPDCLSPTIFNDPDLDCDKDGFTDGQEYLSETDPSSANSSLQIDQVDVTKGTGVVIKGVVGRLYILERSLDLNTWEIILSMVPDEAGSVTLMDPSLPTGTAFYRVSARLP